MNKSAQELGRLAKGIPKTMTANGIEARRNNLVKARLKLAKDRQKKVKARK
jgi:hypothetical protein